MYLGVLRILGITQNYEVVRSMYVALVVLLNQCDIECCSECRPSVDVARLIVHQLSILASELSLSPPHSSHRINLY